MAKELVDVTMQAGKVTDYEVLPDVMTGKQLEGMVFLHPFYDRKVPIILGDHVTLEAGTGLVHTAPDHGQDDFDVCMKYEAWGLKPMGTVDGSGRYTDKVPALKASSSSMPTYRSSRNWLNRVLSLPKTPSAISIRTAGAARTRSSIGRRNSGLLLSTASVRKPSKPSIRSNGFRPGAMTASTI